MKKPGGFAQQIEEARREFNSWPPELQAGVQLQGSSPLRNRYAEKAIAQARAEQTHRSKRSR